MKLGTEWMPAQLRWLKRNRGWFIRAIDNDFALGLTTKNIRTFHKLDKWYDRKRLVYVKLVAGDNGAQLLAIGMRGYITSTARVPSVVVYVSQWIDITYLRRSSKANIPMDDNPTQWCGRFFHFNMHPPNVITRVYAVDDRGRVMFGWNSVNGYNVGACTVAEFRYDFKRIMDA